MDPTPAPRPPRVLLGQELQQLLLKGERPTKALHTWLDAHLADQHISHAEACLLDEAARDLENSFTFLQVLAFDLGNNELPFDERPPKPSPPGPWGVHTELPERRRRKYARGLSRNVCRAVSQDIAEALKANGIKGGPFTPQEPALAAEADPPQAPEWAVNLAAGKPRKGAQK